MSGPARFAGQRVVVTGAAGGIGAAIARAFHRDGASVVITDRQPPDPDLDLGRLEFLACDVTDPPAVERMVQQARDPSGAIHCLVHTAAILGGSGPFEDVEPETFREYLDVNVMGTMLVAQAVARVMIATGIKGSIVTFGSINSLAAEPNSSPYVTTKGAVRLLTRAIAVDLARHGIRANIVLPGPVTVPRNAALFASPELTEAFDRAIPVGRAAEPEEIVGAVLYLADPANKSTTGTEILVDGGLLARIPLP